MDSAGWRNDARIGLKATRGHCLEVSGILLNDSVEGIALIRIVGIFSYSG
jgi:hypothetical protein